MTKRKTGIVVAAVVLSVLVPLAARAGAKYSYPVVVGTTYGYGSMGSARSSGDASQYIGCQIYYNAGNSGSKIVAACFAADASGAFFYCMSSAPEVLQIVTSMGDGSYIDIGAANSGGTCTYVAVDNFSYFTPMTP